jgi:diaminohydroxyphosphoribosylaminopyrimidine deaminase/5-amino-6-(5-phosphoribosylamino)uracil reductase
MHTLTDELYMQRCIELALLGGVAVAPNPMVGAVIVLDGEIIGEGYHRAYGGPHAEVHAVQSVAAPSRLSEATIYVSLEPCAHHGKTPPCADLIVRHHFKRVVVGSLDPFHAVSGKGIDKIRQAGIEVVVGVLEKACRTLNKRFFTYHQKQRPYITLKWAQTKDGFIDRVRETDTVRQINWISAPETQSLVHQWRSEEQAILVGWKTVENDNPSLTVREISGHNPLRIIIDGQLKMPSDSRVYADREKTLVLNRLKAETSEQVEWVKLPQIDTAGILKSLYDRGIHSVFVEGGRRTLQHFLVDQVWDEARIIVGQNTFGEGVKAPSMSGIPDHCYTFASDLIYQYSRK